VGNALEKKMGIDRPEKKQESYMTLKPLRASVLFSDETEYRLKWPARLSVQDYRYMWAGTVM